eukprot:3997158-Pleurochrysis_carterae.AAC.10
MSRDEDTDGKKLFIGGLSYDTCKEDLKAAFGRFGDITDIRVLSLPAYTGTHYLKASHATRLP